MFSFAFSLRYDDAINKPGSTFQFLPLFKDKFDPIVAIIVQVSGYDSPNEFPPDEEFDVFDSPNPAKAFLPAKCRIFGTSKSCIFVAPNIYGDYGMIDIFYHLNSTRLFKLTRCHFPTIDYSRQFLLYMVLYNGVEFKDPLDKILFEGIKIKFGIKSYQNSHKRVQLSFIFQSLFLD